MTLLHFAAMYALMYSMVNLARYAIPNSNQLYMAGLMTAPMLIFELLLMRDMYPQRRANIAFLGVRGRPADRVVFDDPATDRHRRPPVPR